MVIQELLIIVAVTSFLLVQSMLQQQKMRCHCETKCRLTHTCVSVHLRFVAIYSAVCARARKIKIIICRATQTHTCACVCLHAWRSKNILHSDTHAPTKIFIGWCNMYILMLLFTTQNCYCMCGYC